MSEYETRARYLYQLLAEAEPVMHEVQELHDELRPQRHKIAKLGRLAFRIRCECERVMQSSHVEHMGRGGL